MQFGQKVAVSETGVAQCVQFTDVVQIGGTALFLQMPCLPGMIFGAYK